MSGMFPRHPEVRSSGWSGAEQPIDGSSSELVHGIVSVDPPRVRCDGCGFTAEGKPEKLNLLILTCGITFNHRAFRNGDQRRLCKECQVAAGWRQL